MSFNAWPLTVLLSVCVLTLPVRAADAPARAEVGQTKKKVVLYAGGPSHGFGAHDHKAGCMLLAKRINAIPGFEAAVYYKDWPKPEAFEDANAVVMYCDGGKGHPGLKHLDELKALNDKGTGIGCIHYAVEVPTDTGGPQWLDWTGGYFEVNWSINPHWTADFRTLPQHAVARGVRPFTTNDEWYYNMRFRENMEGVTPILSAVPPEGLKGSDPTRNGAPEIRTRKGVAEHVLWVSENKNGSRGFGCTGGHFHANWANDDFRKVVLNAIVWIAKGDVPENGVESQRPDGEEMLANYDEAPNDKQKGELLHAVEEANKPKDGEGGPK